MTAAPALIQGRPAWSGAAHARILATGLRLEATSPSLLSIAFELPALPLASLRRSPDELQRATGQLHRGQHGPGASPPAPAIRSDAAACRRSLHKLGVPSRKPRTFPSKIDR